MLAALSEKIPYPSSVELVEILAARRAVRFIVELGMSQSIFEVDSEIVYKALKSVDVGHSSIGQYVKDIMLFPVRFELSLSLILGGRVIVWLMP